ncbi:MAG: saccharopine dehydrogenase family protein, partial [Sphingomonadales bacterium]
MNNIEVVLYGASGYTGEHVMWKLAERGIPFIAAGRNKAKLERRIAEQPELANARYEVVEVPHDEAALTDLLRGRKVVHNLVGPYAQYGEPVVKAALASGCHYLDATGEQDWKIHIREAYGKAFADKGLVLSPAASSMWVSGLLAAESVLEKPGIDSVDILYTLVGVPSPASTLSFMRMCCQPQLRLVQNQLVPWPAAAHFPVSVPGVHQVLTALPWSGGGESLFYEHDDRVINCSTLVTFLNQGLMALLVPKMEEFAEKYAHLPTEEQEAATNAWAMQIAPEGDMPREDYL